MAPLRSEGIRAFGDENARRKARDPHSLSLEELSTLGSQRTDDTLRGSRHSEPLLLSHASGSKGYEHSPSTRSVCERRVWSVCVKEDEETAYSC